MAGACCVGVISLFAGAGGYDAAKNVFSDPKPYGLQFVSLEYRDGRFTQDIRVLNADAVRAEWAAKIMRGTDILCAGGGTSTYQGKLVTMAPDVWVGDNCPPLEAGDMAFASWTYENVNGKNVTISGELEIR